jgi:hypothetical protein
LAAVTGSGLNITGPVVGVGYNFTDFADDLTDLSYRSRGPFVNILSTF